MRALSIAICLLASTPALAAEIYPATGSVLPPQPSLFIAGTPELTLNVTSNDQLVPYTVLPTDILGLVRVDIALAAGPLRIGHDERGMLGEFLVAEPMPHRFGELVPNDGKTAFVTDAALLRLEWSDGRVTAIAANEPLDALPVQVTAVWSDRGEQLVMDNRPRGCGAVPFEPPRRDDRSSGALALGLCAVLAGLALAIERRISRGSSAW